MGNGNKIPLANTQYQNIQQIPLNNYNPYIPQVPMMNPQQNIPQIPMMTQQNIPQIPMMNLQQNIPQIPNQYPQQNIPNYSGTSTSFLLNQGIPSASQYPYNNFSNLPNQQMILPNNIQNQQPINSQY